jgi:hypothetical protein
MSVSQCKAALRRFGLLTVLTVAGAEALAAQASVANAVSQPRLSIEELTAQWASLELPLQGVPDLSDLQRDAIELLEEKFRKLFNDEAAPIRAARVTLYQRGPFERQNIARAIERMTDLRTRELELTRTLLSDAQRPRFDANLKAIAAYEAAANTQREREAAFYTP